jgi:hypothetical protein
LAIGLFLVAGFERFAFVPFFAAAMDSSDFREMCGVAADYS